jgi:hypothetical protein
VFLLNLIFEKLDVDKDENISVRDLELFSRKVLFNLEKFTENLSDDKKLEFDLSTFERKVQQRGKAVDL